MSIRISNLVLANLRRAAAETVVDIIGGIADPVPASSSVPAPARKKRKGKKRAKKAKTASPAN